jgi:hypothetical protein
VRPGETGNFADPADVGCLLSVAERRLLAQFDVIVGIVGGLWPMYPLNLTEMKIELALRLKCPQSPMRVSFASFQHVSQDIEVNVDPAALDQFVSEENYLQNIKHTSCAEKFRNPFNNFCAKHLSNAFHEPPSESFDNSCPMLLYLLRFSEI